MFGEKQKIWQVVSFTLFYYTLNKMNLIGKCIDTMGQGNSGTIGATPCHGYGGNQLVKLNTLGQMSQGEWCLTPSSGWGGRIRTGYCEKGKVDGPFKFDRVNSISLINFNYLMLFRKLAKFGTLERMHASQWKRIQILMFLA
jgi:hypothetical protein